MGSGRQRGGLIRNINGRSRMSKEVKFKNGLTVRAYVGDGFDGASGLYFHVGRYPGDGKVTYSHLSGLSERDLKRLRKLIQWWVDKEHKLRRWEGRQSTNQYAIEESLSTYSAIFLLGQLDLLLNPRAKQYANGGDRFWPITRRRTDAKAKKVTD